MSEISKRSGAIAPGLRKTSPSSREACLIPNSRSTYSPLWFSSPLLNTRISSPLLSERDPLGAPRSSKVKRSRPPVRSTRGPISPRTCPSMSSSSSSLYDATLAGLDFRTLLPGLWGLGTDEGEVSDTETVKGSGTASASRKVGARSAALAADEFALAPRPRADADLRATVDVAPGQGMARGKKRGNALKTSKVSLSSSRTHGHVRRLLRHDDARCRK